MQRERNLNTFPESFAYLFRVSTAPYQALREHESPPTSRGARAKRQSSPRSIDVDDVTTPSARHTTQERA